MFFECVSMYRRKGGNTLTFVSGEKKQIVLILYAKKKHISLLIFIQREREKFNDLIQTCGAIALAPKRDNSKRQPC